MKTSQFSFTTCLCLSLSVVVCLCLVRLCLCLSLSVSRNIVVGTFVGTSLDKIGAWRVPGGVLGTSLGRLGPQTPKIIKKITFGEVLFDHMLTHVGTCLVTVFLHVFQASLLLSFWRPRHPQASISKAFGCHLGHILNKPGKVETTIPFERGLENQALGGLCFSLFCQFHVHVFGTCLFHELFDDSFTFDAFVCVHWGAICHLISQLF